jgi:DNA repair exonuclease SbcCD nuclease subunit
LKRAGGKTIILGDLHLGARGGNKFFEENQRRFFEGIFFPLLEADREIKTVIQLGDFFDSRVSANFQTIKLANEIIEKFEDLKVRLFAILGNHDIYYKQSLKLSGIREIAPKSGCFQAVDRPVKIEAGGSSFILIPWACAENRKEIEEFLEKEKADFLCGHFEMEGFKISQNYYSEKSSFPRGVFSGFKKVFSGHYHIASDSRGICYVGSPYELSWHDFGEEKRFMICDGDQISEFKTNLRIHHKIFWDGHLDPDAPFPRGLRGFMKIFADPADLSAPEWGVFSKRLAEENPDLVSVSIIARERNGLAQFNPASISAEDPFSFLLKMISASSFPKGVSKERLERKAIELFESREGRENAA